MKKTSEKHPVSRRHVCTGFRSAATHEATSRLFERGVFDSMEVASITGHKTLAMLKRYTHLKAEDLARKLG
ncbi:MAG: hypothetical protein U1C60_03090 [Rhodocyclaceae bacterium]|nr:hypothetical protein [Rhodocyclaceae bacterium]